MSVLTRERTTIEKAVQEGVNLLDEKGPDGWRELIDVGRLDIGAACDCVLGQVYGSFQRGLDELHTAGAGGWKYGFNHGTHEERKALNEAWKEELA